MPETEYLLADTAKALLGQPVYICLESEGVPDDACWRGTLAFTGRTLDVRLRPWLLACGRWEGRQPCIVFDDALIDEYAAQSASEFGGSVADIAESIALSALLHELSHIAQKGVDRSERTPALETFASAILQFSIAVQDSRAEIPILGNGHDATFARLACHLHYRAAQIGCDCPLHWVYDGEQYDLPDIDRCAYTLDREVHALRHEPIFDIPEFTPPFFFRQLFQFSNPSKEQRNDNSTGQHSKATR